MTVITPEHVAEIKARRVYAERGALVATLVDNLIETVEDAWSRLDAANAAFDECMGEYAKELVADETWRKV